MYYFYLILFAAGLLGGFLAGLLGIGGGIIFIVVIPYALTELGIPSSQMAPFIVANSIFSTFFASLSGSVFLIRKKMFRWKEVFQVGMFATISSFLLLHFFVNTSHYSKRFFSFFVIIILILILLKMLFMQRIKKKYFPEMNSESTNYIGYIIVGITAGIIASLTGLGGGVIVVSMLTVFMNFPIQQSNSISQGVICINSFAMTLFNLAGSPNQFHSYQIGYIIFPIALVISCGVLLTSTLGIRAAHKLPAKTIQYLFASFILLLLLKKSWDLYVG